MNKEQTDNQLIGQNYKTTYHWLAKDFLFFKREHQFEDCPHVETDVFGRFWMLWFLNIKENSLAISRNGLQHPKGDLALLIPPFSIVEWHIRAKVMNWHGYAWPDTFFGKERTQFNKVCMYKNIFNERPKNQTEIFTKLATEKPCMIIEKEELGCQKAKEIKGYLDHNFNEELNISDVAKTLNLKNYQIGRIFKREYGINPIIYLQKLRVINAIHSMLFLNPDKISSVAFDNGFSDLSRFNKNFVKIFKSTPSQHLKMAPQFLGCEFPSYC